MLIYSESTFATKRAIIAVELAYEQLVEVFACISTKFAATGLPKPLPPLISIANAAHQRAPALLCNPPEFRFVTGHHMPNSILVVALILLACLLAEGSIVSYMFLLLLHRQTNYGSTLTRVNFMVDCGIQSSMRINNHLFRSVLKSI